MCLQQIKHSVHWKWCSCPLIIADSYLKRFSCRHFLMIEESRTDTPVSACLGHVLSHWCVYPLIKSIALNFCVTVKTPFLKNAVETLVIIVSVQTVGICSVGPASICLSISSWLRWSILSSRLAVCHSQWVFVCLPASGGMTRGFHLDLVWGVSWTKHAVFYSPSHLVITLASWHRHV